MNLGGALRYFDIVDPSTWIASKENPSVDPESFRIFTSLMFSKNPVQTSLKKWYAADRLSLCNGHTMYFALLDNLENMRVWRMTKFLEDRVQDFLQDQLVQFQDFLVLLSQRSTGPGSAVDNRKHAAPLIWELVPKIWKSQIFNKHLNFVACLAK